MPTSYVLDADKAPSVESSMQSPTVASSTKVPSFLSPSVGKRDGNLRAHGLVRLLRGLDALSDSPIAEGGLWLSSKRSRRHPGSIDLLSATLSGAVRHARGPLRLSADVRPVRCRHGPLAYLLLHLPHTFYGFFWSRPCRLRPACSKPVVLSEHHRQDHHRTERHPGLWHLLHDGQHRRSASVR